MDEIAEINEIEEKERLEHLEYLTEYLSNSLRFMYSATSLNSAEMLMVVALAFVDLCHCMYLEENEEEIGLEVKTEIDHFLIDTLIKELGMEN